MKNQESYPQYRHFEEWAARYIADSHTGESAPELPILVDIYSNQYPGRTTPTLIELISLAREWLPVQEQVNDIGKVMSRPDVDDGMNDEPRPFLQD